jgi:hypothetical protein
MLYFAAVTTLLVETINTSNNTASPVSDITESEMFLFLMANGMHGDLKD